MHDPTEGGVSGALWELAEACGHALEIDPAAILIPEIARVICQHFEINPLETIASGALLLTTPADQVEALCCKLQAEGIDCADIGTVQEGIPQVIQDTQQGTLLLPRPKRDEIARLFESLSPGSRSS
jgi:hydrogenase maturation factor